LTWLISSITYSTATCGERGGAVVEALRYKSEGRGIDSRWFHWNFSLSWNSIDFQLSHRDVTNRPIMDNL
jgi:hypothetical protein